MSEVRTRSGRISKKPEKYEPVEIPTDDFRPDEYDTDDDSDVSSAISYSEEELNTEDEEFIDDDDYDDEEEPMD